ncbi:hypothetical protein AeNC1_009961 [Aphanomyces euteiches]|nr:hypothetical protein AeNC1_009961 [Aphanomyces euteiches]
MTLTLFCVVIGEERPFPVKIDAAEYVGILKQTIHKVRRYQFLAQDMDLYNVNGLILNEDEQFLYQQSPMDMTSCSLKDFAGSTRRLVTTYPLSYYPQLKEDSPDGRIHVLVVVPSADGNQLNVKLGYCSQIQQVPMDGVDARGVVRREMSSSSFVQVKMEIKRQRTYPREDKLDFSVNDISFGEITCGSFIKISGVDISRPSQDNKNEMWMYCREDTMRLIKKLNEVDGLYKKDGEGKHRGVWIKGPPGVGKSITTWFWACKQAGSGKSVLWIHVDVTSDPRLVRMTQEGTWSIVFSDIHDISPYVVEAKDDIVVIDGVAKENRHIKLKNKVFNFQVVKTRYAISVTSMSIKRNDEARSSMHVQRTLN